MPNFLIALLLIFLFGVTLRWLPVSGYTDPLEDPVNGLRSLTLPAITLGLALAAVITRTLRSSLIEALSEDYVRTARAKGLSERVILGRHALKNGLIPVVTVLGLQLGGLIGGAVITEYVFALPGVGRLVVDAVFARDYPAGAGGRPADRRGLHPAATWRWTSSTAGSTRGSDIAEHASRERAGLGPRPRGRPRRGDGWRCGGWPAGGSRWPAPR